MNDMNDEIRRLTALLTQREEKLFMKDILID